jgi:adenine-specific DNA glycosylase
VSPLIERWTFCIRHKDQFLIEQRPMKGRWAGMWQFATIEPENGPVSPALLKSRYSLRTTEPVKIGFVEHALTHRRYRFEVFQCENLGKRVGEWATLEELEKRPMPRPHLRIREMIEQSRADFDELSRVVSTRNSKTGAGTPRLSSK